MKKLPFLILVFLMCLPIQADWDDIKSKLSLSSNIYSESKSDLEPESFIDSTNLWFVVKSENVSAYSHNRNFSIYLKNSAEAFINKLSTNFNITIPQNFHCKLFAFDNQKEMMEYLSDSVSGIDVERWYENESLLTYRFSNKHKLRRKVFRDDIPYLMTLAVLNKIDAKNKIPETLKIGFAISTEQSVSNKLQNLRYNLLDDNEKWIDYKTLFKIHFDAYDEPEFIDNIEAESALWAMYIRNKLSHQQTEKLIFNLANGADLQKTFANTFDVGMFDTMPRLEEHVRKWHEKEFPVKQKTTFYLSTRNKNMIIISFAGLIFIIIVSVIYKWLKDLIG